VVGLRLRGVDVAAPASLADGDGAVVEIDVLPLQGQQFAGVRAGGGHLPHALAASLRLGKAVERPDGEVEEAWPGGKHEAFPEKLREAPRQQPASSAQHSSLLRLTVIAVRR
jgi:hypothetical protein